jgi:hypothetical protein
MRWTRICAAAFLCIVLSGCVLFLGENMLTVDMHRASDRAKVACTSGMFGGVFGEPDARRIMNACILACRKRGFVETGKATQIDEASSVLRPEEGWANAPTICQS